MKKTTEPAQNMSFLDAFYNTMRSDLKRSLQPLQVLLWAGWRREGMKAAGRAFLRAQREKFPQGLFSALILLQGLLVALLLAASAIAYVVSGGGFLR